METGFNGELSIRDIYENSGERGIYPDDSKGYIYCAAFDNVSGNRDKEAENADASWLWQLVPALHGFIEF